MLNEALHRTQTRWMCDAQPLST